MTETNEHTILSLSERIADNGDCTRQFEVELTDFVNSQTDDSLLQSLLQSDDIATKYIGFYGLFVYYRHMMEYNKLKELFYSYEQLFSCFKSFGHLRTNYYIDSDEAYTSEDVFEHLRNSYAVAADYKRMSNRRSGINVAGTQHAFANLFAAYCERYENMQSEIAKKWSKKALAAVDEAIRLSPAYAKYHCTKGQILSYLHEYDSALCRIQRAIALESPSANRASYSLRILQYQSCKVQVQARHQIHKLNKQQSRINNDIDKMKSSLLSNIEILGFFSGIISFIIGSLTLANGQTAKDAASLILVLLGSLLIVFDCFGLLLYTGRKNLPTRLVVLTAGVLIVIGGLYLVL